MTVPGSAVPFPNPQGVDPRRIRMWDPTQPGRPEHGVGDLIVGMAPPAGTELRGFKQQGWTFDGPVWLPGFDIRPIGTLAADYSTPQAPVLGTDGPVGYLKFSAKARTHWDWDRGRDAFLMLDSSYVDYRDNSEGRPASFGDLFKVEAEGKARNNRPGRNNGQHVSVLFSRVRLINGPAYVPNTTNPLQNGHTDLIQCMGGVDNIEAGDCYLQVVGAQLFFLGREASLCGYNTDSLWKFTRVTLDHIPPWNPNVRPHALNSYPKLVQGFENAKGMEVTNLSAGQYLATRFTDCCIRGPYAKDDLASIRQYLGPHQPILGVDPDGMFRFAERAKGRHNKPLWSGTLRYYAPGETLPTLCPPKNVGPDHRVTNPEQALAAMLGTL